jgi:hypothetical protein
MKRYLLTSFGLAGLLACGGGSSGGATTHGLFYTNPSLGQGQYGLVLDATSTSSVLVLDLVGPSHAASSSGTSAVGVSFGFDTDPSKAAWASSPVKNGTLFGKNGASLLCNGWSNAGRVQGVAANKGLLNQVTDIGPSAGIIATLTLTPVPGATGGTVKLVDNGMGTVLDIDGTPVPIQILVGTLTVQ